MRFGQIIYFCKKYIKILILEGPILQFPLIFFTSTLFDFCIMFESLKIDHFNCKLLKTAEFIEAEKKYLTLISNRVTKWKNCSIIVNC